MVEDKLNVTVTIQLSAEDKAYLNETFANGMQKIKINKQKRGYYVVASDMDWEDIEKTVIIGGVDAVIVVDLARITRKYAEYVSTKNIFKVFGVRLVIAPNYKGGKVR